METAEIRELISAFVPEEILRDFELKEVKKDYWAEGFDLYAMEYGGWK